MIRLFRTNDVRKVAELEGMWDFAVLDGADDAPDYTYRLAVPGCWETHPQLSTYRGRGMYRTTVRIGQRTNVRFVFKGVSHTAAVRLDGRELGSHYNAYTAFSVIAKQVEPGEHVLEVAVDNGFHDRSALHLPNDYYTYGGIIRPVALEYLPDVYIERMQVTPRLVDGAWHAAVRVWLGNVSEEPRRARIAVELAGQQLELGEAAAPPGGTCAVAGDAVIRGAEPWSRERPSLFMCHAKLYADGADEPTDDLIERIGFREVTTRNGRIQINGRDIVLKGFNRHEDHPHAGSALPLALMAHDLDMIEAAGANCVRTSHYPNDERFLDLCDERGIYVWEENHARGFSLEQMRHPLFAEQCETVNREMVEQHANHPSIVIWGILNECASNTEEGRSHYKRQLEQIRALDGSRPLTFASHHREHELCFDLADIVSLNLYPGWYTDEDPGELVDQARRWADTAGGAGKPLIMSEFGADGYYGLREPGRARGTEERQADILEANLAAYMSRDFISGVLVWQFCDCRVSEATGWLLTRAGTQNSKGVVDRYRRPKLAYETVSRWFMRAHPAASVPDIVDSK